MKRAVYLILLILALVAPAIYLVGCTVEQTEEARGWLEAPLTKEVAKAVPFGDVILGLAIAGLGAWGTIQRRKVANRDTIIRTATPAIQAAPETVKEQVKLAQGPKLSALAKDIRAS